MYEKSASEKHAARVAKNTPAAETSRTSGRRTMRERAGNRLPSSNADMRKKSESRFSSRLSRFYNLLFSTTHKRRVGIETGEAGSARADATGPAPSLYMYYISAPTTLGRGKLVSTGRIFTRTRQSGRKPPKDDFQSVRLPCRNPR